MRPIVIVDPRSSGIELAPAFKAKGIPVIAVTFQPLSKRNGFGSDVKRSDFLKVISHQNNLIDILESYNPLAIIPGAEAGIALADSLCASLTPEFANCPDLALHRTHKAYMQEALKEAGVPFLKTIHSHSEEEVEKWIESNELTKTPLIVKPPVSAGSDKVFHIEPGKDWREAFRIILSSPSNVTGNINETAIVQEQAIGTEFAIGTVSAKGEHSLVHMIRYNKKESGGRKTVYDHVEFVPFHKDIYGELFDYTKKVLDALGVRWGASHTEVILTAQGPRLIETGARMLGGPTVGFARAATGSSQADKIVEAYSTGKVQEREYSFKQTVMPVFINAPKEGVVTNVKALDEVSDLATLFQKHLWFKNGDTVRQSVDYLTSLGIVALAGERDAILRDYQRIREMEKGLIFS